MSVKVNLKVEDKLFNLEKIFLSTNNPRYTVISSLDDDLIGNIANLSKKSQNEVAFELLRNEGNFKDFKRLLSSIDQIGFKSLSEKIFLVENSMKKEEYVVAEGNRRILALKLITKQLSFPSFSILKTYKDASENINSDDENLEKVYISKQKNYEECMDIANKIFLRDILFTIDCQLIKENSVLWEVIYTKHIAGERPGMRKWSRGKYFADLLSIFKNGISISNSQVLNDVGKKNNQKIEKRIIEQLQREPEVLVEDFKHAQFVKNVIRFSSNFDFSEAINDENIFSIMSETPVSALQYNFSLKRIKDSANEFLDISETIFEKDYFSFSFDKETNLIEISDKNKKISSASLFRFIYEIYGLGFLTTRPIPFTRKYEFNEYVKNFLFPPTEISERITKEEIFQINPFEQSQQRIEELIVKSQIANIEEKHYRKFLVMRSIYINRKTVTELKQPVFMKSSRPIIVFEILKKQYLYNHNHNYFNAAAISMRSLIEQFLIWGAYFSDASLKKVMGNFTSKDKIEYISRISSQKIHDLSKKIFYKKNDTSLKDGSKLETKVLVDELAITEILNSMLISKEKNIERARNLSEHYSSLLENLNDYIHASHRIYTNDTVDEYIIFFEIAQRIIIDLINFIDYAKINDLSEEIYIQITELNKLKK